MSRYRVLFKATDNIRRRIEHADTLRQEVDISYRNATGKENALASRYDRRSPHTPVVCCVEDVGYWHLVCNDPDVDESVLDEIAANLRKWCGSPALT